MQTATLTNLKHTYQCPKKWASIVDKNDPEFCTLCQHKVYDLSSKSPQEIERLLDENNGEMCARFYPEQMENWEAEPAPRIKVFLATITAMLAFSTIKSYGQTTNEVKTEVIEYKYTPDGEAKCVKPVEKTSSCSAGTEAEENTTTTYRRKYVKIGRLRIYKVDEFPYIKMRIRRKRGGKITTVRGRR